MATKVWAEKFWWADFCSLATYSSLAWTQQQSKQPTTQLQQLEKSVNTCHPKLGRNTIVDRRGDAKPSHSLVEKRAGH